MLSFLIILFVPLCAFVCSCDRYKVEMTLSEESEDVNRLVGKITKGDDVVYHLIGMARFLSELICGSIHFFLSYFLLLIDLLISLCRYHRKED